MVATGAVFQSPTSEASDASEARVHLRRNIIRMGYRGTGSRKVDTEMLLVVQWRVRQHRGCHTDMCISGPREVQDLDIDLLLD
jgi:hypothetical protein